MFQKITFDQFTSIVDPNFILILFIKEQGCIYCQVAEDEIKSDEFLKSQSFIKFYEIMIDDEPKLPSQLCLVGVPTFFKIDIGGRKKLKQVLKALSLLLNLF